MAVVAQAKSAQAAARTEARWPVAVGIVCVFLLLAVLPERVRLLPVSVLWAPCAAVLAPLALASLARPRSFWQRVETVVTLLFVATAGVANLAFLFELLKDIIGRSGPVSGLALLSASIAVWCVNVLMFSLLYWQMDRGGPGGRASASRGRPDWSFPQESASEEDVPPDWRPSYPDYLFLSFSTATAFSTTEVPPFTTRAKMFMMAEATVSLMTLALVAARAVNILGS
jgi:hypothetical protein